MKIITPKPNWREGLVATEVDETTGEFGFAGKRYRLEPNEGAFALQQLKKGPDGPAWAVIGSVLCSDFAVSWIALSHNDEAKACASGESPFHAALKLLVRI